MATRKSIETSDRIRSTALELFREKGFDNVTVMQICESAGVSKRTFYYHFNSKADILIGLTSSVAVKAENLLSSIASQQSNVSMLWELMSSFCKDNDRQGPVIIRQIFIQTAQGRTDEDFPFSTYMFDIAVRFIENAQRAGEISAVNPPKDIAFLMFHALRSVSFTWAAESGNFNILAAYKKAFCVALGMNENDMVKL